MATHHCVCIFHAVNDFNDTEIIATIPPRTTRWEQGIQIFDDNINEAEEVFNVLLTVEGNLTVEYLIRTAVCRIPESDRKHLYRYCALCNCQVSCT